MLGAKAGEFGENGGKVLLMAYDGGMEVERYLAGFTECYQAGLTGEHIGKAVGRNAQALSKGRRYAVYDAGQKTLLNELIVGPMEKWPGCKLKGK